VQIPLKGNDSLQNSDNIERAKAAIGRVVKIEFKEKRNEITQDDIDARFAKISDAFQDIQESSEDFYVLSEQVVNDYDNTTS